MPSKNKRDLKHSIRQQAREKGCRFCQEKKVPNWQEYEELRSFLSPRGRIMGRLFTGVCVRHQKLLTEAIKRARHLALLPYITQES